MYPTQQSLKDKERDKGAIAWQREMSSGRPSHHLRMARLLDARTTNGCIAVDEVQDLTPLEAFVVLALGRRLNAGGRQAPLLLAGDEAQTCKDVTPPSPNTTNQG